MIFDTNNIIIFFIILIICLILYAKKSRIFNFNLVNNEYFYTLTDKYPGFINSGDWNNTNIIEDNNLTILKKFDNDKIKDSFTQYDDKLRNTRGILMI